MGRAGPNVSLLQKRRPARLVVRKSVTLSVAGTSTDPLKGLEFEKGVMARRRPVSDGVLLRIGNFRLVKGGVPLCAFVRRRRARTFLTSIVTQGFAVTEELL